MKSGKIIRTIEAQKSGVQTVTAIYSPNGKSILSCSAKNSGNNENSGMIAIWEGDVKLWNLSDGKLIKSFG